jgi:hypothetical protein
MFRRTFAILISVLALAGVAAGCGGDDDSSSSAEPLTKAEYVKQAETFCKDLYKDVQKQLAAAAKAQEGVPASKKSEEQLVNTIIVPTLEKQGNELSQLGTPEGDEEQVDEILVALDKVRQEAETNPVGTLAKPDPFLEVDQLMKDYGIEACRH